MTAERIFLEAMTHQVTQALEALAQIGGSTSQVDPGGWTNGHHRPCSSCANWLASAKAKPPASSSTTPLGKRTWKGCLPWALNRLGTSTNVLSARGVGR